MGVEEEPCAEFMWDVALEGQYSMEEEEGGDNCD